MDVWGNRGRWLTASVEMKKGIGNAVSKVNSETSRMVAVRAPMLRTTANSRTMAEMMANKEDGMTLKIFKGILGKNSMTAMEVKPHPKQPKTIETWTFSDKNTKNLRCNWQPPAFLYEKKHQGVHTFFLA